MLSAALLLGSCGGGGAASTGQGGNLILLPLTGTMYAGMPFTFTIAGGRGPYRVSSSDQGIAPVPSTIGTTVGGATLTVIPNNPGVIDVGIQPGQLPVRTVTISITDFSNGFQQSQMTVAQNFLTGYGVFYTSNCATSGSSTTPPPACGGGETTIEITPTFNGSLVGARTLRLERIRGDFKFYLQNGQLAGDGSQVTVQTDHEGKTNAFFRVDTGVQTQLALYRIVDVETGVSTEQLFTITGNPISATLTVIPNSFEFTGATTQDCGTGSARFLVFDGIPPYKAVSSFAEVQVSPSSSNEQPGSFTLNVSDSSTCLSKATVIITDSRLARGTLTVDTKVGTGAPPPTPLQAIPTNFPNVPCGGTVSVLVTGGSGGTISATTNAPNLNPASVTVAGNVVSVTANPTVGVIPPVTGTVFITDGSSSTSFSVRTPTSCTP